MEVEDESSPLLVNFTSVRQRQTKYRWIIGTLFSFLCFLQLTIWSTWAPISVSATKAIGFSPHDYDLLVNWLPIGGMVTTPFLIWIINRYGVRPPVVISSVLIAAGSGLRCIPVSGRWEKYVIHIGQFLNAMAGGVTLSAPALISNTWFPPQERVLATSCMIAVGSLGSAASFLVGPAIVELPNNCSGSPSNGTYGGLRMRQCVDNVYVMRKQIDHYLYGEFGLASLACLLTILLFRNKPKIPPSASAAIPRLGTMAGLKNLSKRYSWLAASVSFCLVNGAYFGWSGVVTAVLTPHGIPEKTVDTAALVMTCTGAIMGIAAGWFSDRVRGRVKWILVACYVGMFFSILYLVIIVMKWINAGPFQYSEGGLWASLVLFGTLDSITLPLGVELLVDTAYPVSEGTSTALTTWAAMMFMFVYLLVLNSVKNQDLANYLLLGVIAIGTPVLGLSVTNRNSRLAIDENEGENTDRDVGLEGQDDFPSLIVKTEPPYYHQPVV